MRSHVEAPSRGFSSILSAGAAAASQEQTDLQAKVDSAAREGAASVAAHKEAVAAFRQQMVQAEQQSRADKKVSPARVCHLWSHQHFVRGGALTIFCARGAQTKAAGSDHCLVRLLCQICTRL